MGDEVSICRAWSMPNRWTFRMKPVREFIRRHMEEGEVWVDPFAGTSSMANITNDLSPDSPAQFHMRAEEFLASIPDCSVDGVLYDPPYTPRQVKECYDRVGIDNWDGRNSLWAEFRRQIARVVKPGGKVISFGYTSSGIGKKNGFRIVEILLVNHGSGHNDTICTFEIKEG